MKKFQWGILGSFLISSYSCSAIEGIFKAGFYTAIILIIIIVVIFGFVLSKMKNK